MLGQSKMVQLKIVIYPSKVKRKELLTACRMISKQTRRELGCIDCRVFQTGADRYGITFEQLWEQRYLLDNYFGSHHYRALLGAMQLLATNYKVTINSDIQPGEPNRI